MQYPQFRQKGWPIGSGMVESANKNIVEARLKGSGMHWERKNVNSMLALRNAVCNDRWQEMWHKALKQHRQQQALHRTSRAEQRTQALLSVGDSSSVESSPHSAAASEHISPPAPCQPASKALSPSVPPPAAEASQHSFRRLSSRRTRQTARNRLTCSQSKTI
jgi:hypothetical protein